MDYESPSVIHLMELEMEAVTIAIVAAVILGVTQWVTAYAYSGS